MDVLEIPELRRLACTPDRLTTTQVDAVKQSQKIYTRRLAILQDRKEELVKKLNEQLLEIDREVSQKSDCIEACQQALSPMNHVPEDILREIFLHHYLCFPFHCEDERSFSPLRPPIVTSQVCRRWRAVVHDFAPLWAKLRTNIETQRWDQTGLELLRQWVQRAKSVPLDLQLELVFGNFKNDKSSILPVSKFIGQLIEPIGSSLTRLLLRYVTLDDLSSLSLLPLPSLEQLVLSLQHSVALRPENVSASFKHALALRRVSFSGSEQDSIDRKVLLPWNQITHFLSFCCPDYFEFFLLNYLPLCTQLRFSSFELSEGEIVWNYLEGFRNTGPKIVIPSLETLALDFTNIQLRVGVYPYPNIFFPFEFPKLRKLVLLFSSIAEDVMSSSFLAELRRLKNLEHVSVTIRNGDENAPTPVWALWDTLQVLPHITTLELSLQDNYTGILEQLTVSPDQHVFLPNLRTLGLMFDANTACHDSHFIHSYALSHFIESRATGTLATPVETIEILVCDYSATYATLERVREVLQPFLGEGLLLKIKRVKATENPSWAHFDPELEGRPQLLELY
jgi:hypothetical protein